MLKISLFSTTKFKSQIKEKPLFNRHFSFYFDTQTKSISSSKPRKELFVAYNYKDLHCCPNWDSLQVVGHHEKVAIHSLQFSFHLLRGLCLQ